MISVYLKGVLSTWILCVHCCECLSIDPGDLWSQVILIYLCWVILNLVKDRFNYMTITLKKTEHLIKISYIVTCPNIQTKYLLNSSFKVSSYNKLRYLQCPLFTHLSIWLVFCNLFTKLECVLSNCIKYHFYIFRYNAKYLLDWKD